ncbi:Virulence protein [Serratia fonticola]|nr:Virulence protein [Serratia fonticola]
MARFAEDQARRRQRVFPRDLQDKLDQFLQFNDREVLEGAGKIGKKTIDEKCRLDAFSLRATASFKSLGRKGNHRFTTVENQHQQVAFMLPLSTSKIILR